MHAWTKPELRKLDGIGSLPELYDSAQGRLVVPQPVNDVASLYVCGITPYDATHMGHAFTYLAFDTLLRAWVDAGVTYQYVQNITDIDDPLLERAAVTHVDWVELAASQVELFKEDMSALAMLPPTSYVAVTEEIDLIAESVQQLREQGFAYEVATAESASGNDIYFDTDAASRDSIWQLGQICCGLDLEDMHRLSAERGGDPDRPGKRGALDPLLWRAAREGEPSWPSAVGAGRPGWHIECSAIAVRELGTNFAVQGGGLDLLFPHHEFSAAHASAATGSPLAQVFAHAGLVSYNGEKMSKSRGNLVFVSHLLRDGIEPSAIRLALLRHHYRSSWEWFDSFAADAERELARWRDALQSGAALEPSVRSAEDVVQQLRRLLAADLDTPAMLHEINIAFEEGTDNPDLIRTAAHALLGLEI